MRNIIKKLVFLGVLSAFAIAVLTAGVAAQDKESAGGQGSIRVQDENGKTVKRQFSFQARRGADGIVKGQANLHNGSFNGANGKKYAAKFDISCLKIVGNIAVVGGFIRRTNDQNLIDAAYFTVEDNGEPGKNDRISSVFFFDADPSTTGSPALCENTAVNAFPFMNIDSGNIQVRGGTTP